MTLVKQYTVIVYIFWSFRSTQSLCWPHRDTNFIICILLVSGIYLTFILIISYTDTFIFRHGSSSKINQSSNNFYPYSICSSSVRDERNTYVVTWYKSEKGNYEEYPNTAIACCLGFDMACEQKLISTTIHPPAHLPAFSIRHYTICKYIHRRSS